MVAFLLVSACQTDTVFLEAVTTKEFGLFVESTEYITDAEKYGWSLVQKTVTEFEVVHGVDWRRPSGSDAADGMPVTQVSYNDAVAYCKWANTRLPTYEEYWRLSKGDGRRVIQNSDKIYPSTAVNIVGNAWDITSTQNEKGEVRLAGGSFLCSATTCDGTNPDRELYVSTDTGNTHISFSVVVEGN